MHISSLNRRTASTFVAVAMMASASQVSAGDVGAGILGGIIGGVVGGVVSGAVNSNRQQSQTVVREREVIVERPRTRYVTRTPRIDPYTREQNRRAQTALNYFGFNAGAPDGIMGSRSRAAVSTYQGYMNFPMTGYLTPQEQAFLVTSYDRALAGGAATTQIIAGSPLGVRAVLPHYWSGQTIVAAPPVVAVAPPVVAVAPPVMAIATPQAQQPATTNQITINVPQNGAPAQPAQAAPAAPQTQLASAPPAEEPAKPAAGALPMFVAGNIEASMSSFCARIGAPSAIPGADVQNASLAVEGENVLATQFCAARAEALVESDKIASSIQGVSRSDMQRQCEAFAPSMDRYIATLVSSGADAAKAELQAYVVSTGISMQALSANSRICLGIGYGADNPRVTLASSMILVGIGEVGFGEVLGYHLAYGFGAPENRARAADWLEHVAIALRSGARPVVATQANADRPQLLTVMATRLRGAPAQAAAPQMQDVSTQPAPAPSFQMPGAAPEPKQQL